MDEDRPAPRRPSRLVRLIEWAAWLGVGAFFAALVFGALMRTDPAESGPVETRLVFLALLIQSFAFHAGIAVGGACLLAVLMRRKRLGVVMALGSGLLLGPAAASHVVKDHPAASDCDLVVLSANVLYTNEDPGGLID